MNQDQIKAELLRIGEPGEDFSVVLSGKSSRRVDGLYKPAIREIILHNRNFSTDGELMYAAIHEYAHHIQFTSSPLPPSSRSHNPRFWAIFHDLLFKAEEMSVYANPFKTNEDFQRLTRRIREEILVRNGGLMKRFGELLMEARDLCEEHHVSFVDYLDRILKLPRNSVGAIMKAHEYDLNPSLGFETMRVLTRIQPREQREEAQAGLLADRTPDQIIHALSPPREPDPVTALAAEKRRLESSIQRLTLRLEEVKNRIEEARGSMADRGTASRGTTDLGTVDREP